MEGKEWVWENGAIKEQQIAKYKEIIQKSSGKRLTSLEATVFEDFVSKL
jgi:hypothetical protein